LTRRGAIWYGVPRSPTFVRTPREINPQTALGTVVMHIPAVADLDKDPTEVVATGDWVKVDGDKGIVEVTKRH